MIYIGIIQFNDVKNKSHELKEALLPLSATAPSIIKKHSLTLCYGKLSNMHDIDEAWENSSSILLGRIFSKELRNSFKKENFKSTSNLDKEKILKEIWGKYIYISESKKKSQWEIVTDPTGQLPFFYYTFPNGNILFSSNIEIIYKFLSQKPQYDWQYLCSYVIYGNSSSINTPFQNISELPPGCSLVITENEQKITPFWIPYLHSHHQLKNTADILETTLKSWIEPYQYIYVSLSGGLDSSSLVYCLKEVITEQQTLKAINYYDSQIKSSNELYYARKVCKELDIELIEVDISEFLIFDPHQKEQRLKPNKPSSGLIELRGLEKITEHLPLDSKYTFISGQGSDHIFMSSPSKKLIFDYIIEHGLTGAWEKLNKLVQFYRESYFSILKENFKEIFPYLLKIKKKKRNINNPNIEKPVWIKQQFIDHVTEKFAHPIYDHLSSAIPPGKYGQIDSFYEVVASTHMELMNPENPTFYPFLYQPAAEFALSLPIYDLFDKGYDRYPLRRDISEKFKTDIVWRRDKSHITGSLQLGVKKNLEQILEILSKGHFVKKDLVNMQELRKTVEQIGNGSIKNLWPFIHLASVEIFLKCWEEKFG